MVVQFADGLEPIAIYRGGVRGPWLHARVEDAAALTAEQAADLAAWLAAVDVDPEMSQPATLLVSHDGHGAYVLHVGGQAYAVVFDAMPVWLQGPMPVPPPRKIAKSRL